MRGNFYENPANVIPLLTTGDFLKEVRYLSNVSEYEVGSKSKPTNKSFSHRRAINPML